MTSPRKTGIKTRWQLIDHALRELLRHEDQEKVLELKGAVRWEGDLADWRKGRGRQGTHVSAKFQAVSEQGRAGKSIPAGSA